MARRNGRSPAGRAMAGRLSWGLADQAVSSLTNFILGATVARSLGGPAFGVFSLAWVTYGVALNVSRGLATDPLMVRFGGGVPRRVWGEAAAPAAGTALAVGLVAGVTILAAGLSMGGVLGHAFAALGLVVPVVLLQDACRFAFFAAGAGKKAFANDAVWAVALVPALMLAARHGTVVGFILAWGASAGVAVAWSGVQTDVRPRIRGALGWIRDHRELGARFLVENVSSSGGSQLRAYGLGAISGFAAVGTLRGAEQLLGPFFMLLMGLSLVTVAEGARVLRTSPHRLKHFCMALSGVQAVAALTWGLGVMLLLPDGAGRFVLGPLWDDSSKLILPATLALVGAGLTTGPASGLRALGAARRSLRAQLIGSAAFVTLGLTGAALGAALGSAWGVAAATLGSSSVWWFQLHQGFREYAHPPAAQDDSADNEPEPRKVSAPLDPGPAPEYWPTGLQR